MKFNDEQQLAIDTRNKNILVSAGAGSGKTAVLTERVIKLITDPDTDTDIDNLLILTFTANAAAEMRRRITDRLKELRDELLLHQKEVNKLAKVRKQINLVNKAAISTFDAFANSVVKQYFYKADIDPGIRIAGGDDASELAKISNSVLDELFEEKYAAHDSDFIMLVDYFCFSENNDYLLRRVILNILYKTSSLPFPDKWLDKVSGLYDASRDETTLLFSLTINKIEYMLYQVIPIYRESVSLLQMLKKKYKAYYETKGNVLKTYENCFGVIKDIFENTHKRIIESKSFDEAALYVEKFSLPRVPATIKDAPDEVIHICGSIIGGKKGYKALISGNYINPVKKLIGGYDSSDETINRQRTIITALVNLYKEFNTAYSLKKKELMVASYADIGHYCLKILVNEDGTPSKEAIALGNKFKEIIVDEYQDNNQLQEEILTALAIGRKNLFMVGDVKQSIYRFRYASPEIFTQKYNSYSKSDFSKDDICICLNKNYRSRKSVIDFVNFIFYQIMIKELGGISYDKYAALNAAADFGTVDKDKNFKICGQNELIIYNKSATASTEEDDEISQLYEIDYEAHIAAKKITELTDTNNPVYIYDKTGEYRPCTLSDIAIIMSYPNKYIHQYESILGSYGIPVIAESKANIFNTIEVKTIMSLLKVLDNPYRDTHLITVLHSPMFSVSCNELVKLKLEPLKNKLVKEHESFYGCMIKYITIPTADKSLKEKVEAFLSLSDKVKEMLRTMPFCYVLGRLYDMTDYVNYAGIIKNGAIRINNLKILLKKAEEICNSGITDFSGVVRQLSELEKNGEEITNDTSRPAYNAVNIMSIHKSKGLEYPIIILTQMGHNLITSEKYATVSINTKYGIAFKDFNAAKRETMDSIQLECFKTLYKKDAVSEHLRLLYVAMTRAREKLIMIGGADINKQPEFFEENCEILEENREQALALDFEKIYNAPDFLTLVMKAYENGKRIFQNSDNAFGNIDNILKITRLTDIISIDENSDISYIKELLDEADSQKSDSPEKRELDIKLNRSYLDEAATVLPSKLSISEIKRQHQLEKYNQLEYEILSLEAPAAEEILKKLTINKKQETTTQLDPPDFIYENSDKLTSTQYGTAYHTAFEHIDFTKNSLEEIKNQLLNLKNEGIFNDAEYKAIKPEKILAFLNSDLGKRVSSAKNIYKETPFVMKLSPQEVYRNNKYADTSAGMLVHGIIDLFFEEDDHIILVDYKTDKVDGNMNTKENIAERYRIQLDFYKMAIDRSYSMYSDQISAKKRVTEMYLYLLNTDDYVSVDDFEE